MKPMKLRISVGRVSLPGRTIDDDAYFELLMCCLAKLWNFTCSTQIAHIHHRLVKEKELILLMVKAADLEISMHGDYYGMLEQWSWKILRTMRWQSFPCSNSGSMRCGKSGSSSTFRKKILRYGRLQKLVSRLAILGVVTPPEDLNVKFLRSLPSEWDTHVVVWMNKPDFDTMGLDDLYNNFKIVEQKVKKSTGAINDEKNLAFLTTSGASSTTNINTANPEVSTGTTKVNTASTETSTASFSDATVYAFLSTQPQGSQLVHEDLEQLHDDDLEEMDLKWNMALLSMRANQRTGRKIIIDGSSTAGYDKSKVECFNCHKMGHFSRECRAPRSKDNRNWNQGSSSKAVRIEDASEKAIRAIDGAGFD
ncbi:ribonuclease H-like domain-containing protein [Tanacetum coccineum]